MLKWCLIERKQGKVIRMTVTVKAVTCNDLILRWSLENQKGHINQK